MMKLLCVVCALTLGQSPPPLSEEQRAKISKLTKEAQKEATRLKSLLDARQRELAAVYGKYELDEKLADKLEDDIIDLQKQSLANYRKLQVELRALIGRERFVILKQRIDRMLAPPKDKPSREP